MKCLCGHALITARVELGLKSGPFSGTSSEVLQWEGGWGLRKTDAEVIPLLLHSRGQAEQVQSAWIKKE